MLIREKPTTEFDQYAGSYAEMLDDPLRNQFAQDPLHFHRRKWLLLERLLKLAGVTKVDDRVIGDGTIGPMTTRLSELYSELTKAEGIRVVG